MIKAVMAKSMNVMPFEEIDEQIQALGPGWTVVNTTLTIVPWGEWIPGDSGMRQALHLYVGVVVTLEKPDEVESTK